MGRWAGAGWLPKHIMHITRHRPQHDIWTLAGTLWLLPGTAAAQRTVQTAAGTRAAHPNSPCALQDFVRWDAVVAGHKLYLGETTSVLYEGSMLNLRIKLEKIRWAGCPGGQASRTHVQGGLCM